MQSWHDLFNVKMRLAQDNQKRMQLMIRRTMLVVRKSREQLQQTDELLKHCQAASLQIRIKRPGFRPDPTFQSQSD